jgi:hypothetical protein
VCVCAYVRACVSVALFIQHEKNVCPIIQPYVACLALPYFSILFITCTILGKKLLNLKCVFWFYLQLIFLKGFIALLNINHTCKLQNCSLINQFTTVSLQLHLGESDLAKITAVKTNTQYIKKNTAVTGWNYNRRCLVRLWMYVLYRCWRSTIE